jgi:hypothetical protein
MIALLICIVIPFHSITPVCRLTHCNIHHSSTNDSLHYSAHSPSHAHGRSRSDRIDQCECECECDDHRCTGQWSYLLCSHCTTSRITNRTTGRSGHQTSHQDSYENSDQSADESSNQNAVSCSLYTPAVGVSHHGITHEQSDDNSHGGTDQTSYDFAHAKYRDHDTNNFPTTDEFTFGDIDSSPGNTEYDRNTQCCFSVNGIIGSVGRG